MLVLIANIMNTCLLYSAKNLKMRSSTNGAFSQLYYSAILSIPLILFSIYFTSENIELKSNSQYTSYKFLICIFIAGVVAFCSNIGVFLCATQNSPMATTITGNIKDLVSVMIGLVAFSDANPSPMFLGGLGCSSLGALVYSSTKIKRNEHKLI